MRDAAIAFIIKNAEYRVLIEPAPPHGNGTDNGALASLPGQGFNEGRVGYNSPVKKIPTDLQVKVRNGAVVKTRMCFGMDVR
jgi:hypothetical protein